MTRRLAAVLVTAAASLAVSALALASCADEQQSPSAACFRPRDIDAALAGSAVPRRLADGSALSRCVELSTSDEFLQSLGLVLTQAADGRADAALAGDAAAAEQLGFLVGAAQRGARRGAGVQLELVRRLEGSARQLSAAGAEEQAAMARGLRTGGREG